MKYLKLINGSILPFYDILYTNVWIIKIREEDATLEEIRSFFGNDVITELALLDETMSLIANKTINAKYTSLYLDTEKELFKEYRVIKAAQTLPLLDEDGKQRISPATNEPMTTIIPEETETIEKVNEIRMVYVILEKPHLEDEVESLKQKVGLVNTSTLNLEEYKEYYKKIIGEKCSDFIYSGRDIRFSANTEPLHFSFTLTDQYNIKNLFDTIKGTDFNNSLPYHSDGEYCTVYSPENILLIYTTMQAHITYHTTYCNILNRKIDAAKSIEEIKAITYGMTLTSSEQKQLDTMMEYMKAALSDFVHKTIEN